VRKGYMLNNVMLRPASVIISKRGTEKQEQKGE
jgi:molecular chaperone GrpE (heat shock protein)